MWMVELQLCCGWQVLNCQQLFLFGCRSVWGVGRMGVLDVDKESRKEWMYCLV